MQHPGMGPLTSLPKDGQMSCLIRVFYIQIKIYNISYILLYFLIITIRHYRDDTKRSEITRLPHGYMKQDEDNTRNCTQKTTGGGDEKHRRTTLYK